METTGWKWWKDTKFNPQEFISELVDVWHFGMSILMVQYGDSDQAINRIVSNLLSYCDLSIAPVVNSKTLDEDLHQHIEWMAKRAVFGSFDQILFLKCLRIVGLGVPDLYLHYTAKCALNQFRVAKGYLQGSYRWTSKEDNAHLQNILLTRTYTWEPELIEQIVLAHLELRYAQSKPAEYKTKQDQVTCPACKYIYLPYEQYECPRCTHKWDEGNAVGYIKAIRDELNMNVVEA